MSATDSPATTVTSRVAPEPAPGGSHRRWKDRLLPSSSVSLLLRIIQLGPLLVLGVLWLVMSFASPYFLTPLNLTNLLEATAVVAMLALGQFLVILIGGIDLSTGTAMALITVIGAKASQVFTEEGLLVIAAMLATGMLIGAANGVLIEKLKLGSAFVITLGTMSVVQGIGYLVSEGSTITGMPTLVNDIGSGRAADIPIAALIVAVFAMIAIVLTKYTPWGKWIYAVGGNREAARRAGIPVAIVCGSVFVLSGFAAGVAGVFNAGLTDSGAPSLNFTVLLDAITAVIIGGAALTGGRGSVGGTLVGALILTTIHNGLNLLGVNASWEPVVLGTVLIFAVGMEQVRGRLETHFRLEEARRAGAVDGDHDATPGGTQ